MKKTLLAVALTAASMTAMADTTLSGQVGYIVGSLEDLNNNDGLTVGQTGTSESRFRILSSTDAINGITYATNLEFGLGAAGTTGNVQVTRRVEEITASGSFGKLSVGHGSQASDGVGGLDFSGTGMIWETSGYQPGGVFSDAGFADAGTRLERIRYDSPSFGPVSFAASLDDGNQGSAGTVPDPGDPQTSAKDESSFHVSIKLPAVQARVGVRNKDAKNTDVMAFDIAGELANFTAAAHYVQSEQGVGNTEDEEQVRLILGYKMGAYNFSVNIQEVTEDAVGGGNKVTDITSVGAGLTFAPTKGVELYAGVTQFDNDVTQAAGVDDSATGVILGGKFKF
jgi:hypothetical protein